MMGLHAKCASRVEQFVLRVRTLAFGEKPFFTRLHHVRIICIDGKCLRWDCGPYCGQMTTRRAQEHSRTPARRDEFEQLHVIPRSQPQKNISILLRCVHHYACRDMNRTHSCIQYTLGGSTIAGGDIISYIYI